jgi:large subunit ribosomal protein L10
MEKSIKQEQISFVKGLVDSAECMVLAGIEGLNATQVTQLRADLHKENIGFRVVKNKLARIAIADTDAKDLFDDFVGSTALAWSDDNPISPAKILVKFEKEFEKLKIKAGFSSKARLDEEGIKALSKLPSLDELRAQLLGLFTSPASRLLAQINAPASHTIGVLQAKVDKDKESA